MLLEFGPFASASPLSGGFGIIVVIIFDFILFLIGLFGGGYWQPLQFLMTPFMACGIIALIIFLLGKAWILLMTLFAKRVGLYK